MGCPNIEVLGGRNTRFQLHVGREVVHQQFHKAAMFPIFESGRCRVRRFTQSGCKGATKDLNAAV